MRVSAAQLDRRTVIVVAGLVMGAGCLGDGGGGFDRTGDDHDDTVENDNYGGLPHELEALRDQFEQRGLQVIDVDHAEKIVLKVQTSGDINEDIREASGAYASVVGQLEQDLHVRIEDRGLHQESFEIRRDWAVAFIEGRIEDEEYITRINDTRTNR